MQKFSRRDHLKKIEFELQKEWKNNKIFEIQADLNWASKYSLEEKNKMKHLVTFPYPYMNGKLHLGHAYSLSKCEFTSRFQRLLGKNALFPFSFHCTGMPIAAAANRVKAELKAHDRNIQEILKNPNSQISILKKMGIPEDILIKFEDPIFWLEYFPPFGRVDLEALGASCDFSRSFITTQRQVYYDKFIQWQFNRLNKAGVIKYGKRFTIFSKSDDQPCADHDRSEGEGVGVQEYTSIKLRVVGGRMPENLKKLSEEKKVFLIAATLRPETMYGQTNIYVLPSAEYGVYELRDGDFIVCSHHCAENLSYQEKLKTVKTAECLFKVKGSEIVGIKVNAPLSFYKEIYAIPLLTISMTKGTGIVTSVPSDSPDDYMCLTDFKTDEKLRQKHDVLPEYVNGFDPVKIVNIPEISDLSAVDVCIRMGIKNHLDKEKLAKAKEEVYQKGFYSGVMLVGDYKGEKIEAAKKKVKADLINSGDAFVYCEPESLVKNRTGETCIVALVDQWMISYGEEKWREFVETFCSSSSFESFNPNTKKEILNKINWLKEWGCSRTFGLGSRIPWDQKYLIESLSDSTIYMAFYTISKYFFNDINGDVPNLIKPEQVNDSLFDFVFLGEKSEELEKTGIEKQLLEDMRNEFTYWYPMDLRCSGKDLIPNHLTMSLYNHAFIWNNTEMMPRGIFTNGYLNIDGQKMSKSKGNFKTIEDVVEDYGADATRLTLADCGDCNDDANFLTELANSNINRLYSFENFMKALIKEGEWDIEGKVVFGDIDNLKLEGKFDVIFENNINYLLEQTKAAYAAMKYRDVLKYGFYEMLNIKDQYILYMEDNYKNLNATLMLRYLKVFFTVMNPVMPHWTEYMYREYVNKFITISTSSKDNLISNLAFAKYPVISRSVDGPMFAYNKYLKNIMSLIHELVNSKQDNKKKPKEAKETKEVKEEAKDDKKPRSLFDKQITIYYLPKLSDDQRFVLEVLNSSEFDESNKIVSDYKALIKERITDKQKQIQAFQFGSYIAKEVEKYGKEAMQIDLSFKEDALLSENLDLIKKLTFTKEKKPKGVKQAPIPGSPILQCE